MNATKANPAIEVTVSISAQNVRRWGLDECIKLAQDDVERSVRAVLAEDSTKLYLMPQAEYNELLRVREAQKLWSKGR